MDHSIELLSLTAVTIGFVHTILGPDHYLPFVMLGKARDWSVRKTILITLFAGIGHVVGSVVLGLIGVGVGVSLFNLELIEAYRGDIAAWLLIAFGLVYMVISIRNIRRKKKHIHMHHHIDGTVHHHEHNHKNEHSHFHIDDPMKSTPWVLFIIFVFGPCEPLIPVLMYPAAQGNPGNVILVAVLFSLSTIITMVAMVLTLRFGLSKINLGPVERYSHAIAGGVIMVSGMAIRFLGL